MFVVRVTCCDCTGEDDMGCNNGDPWLLDEGKVFDTLEDAEAAIQADSLDGAPYEYEVLRAPSLVLLGLLCWGIDCRRAAQETQE